MSDYDYDLLVIGSGPGGQAAAINAAKLGKRVAMVERKPYVGGASLQTGTIPSKALREAAYLATRSSSPGMRGTLQSSPASQPGFLADALSLKNQVVNRKAEQMLTELNEYGVTLIHGEASFVDAHSCQIMAVNTSENNTPMHQISAAYIILATGSRPRRPETIPFDKERILDSTSLLKCSELPRSLIVVGGGVIACEFATIFAALGSQVTILDSHAQVLAYMDTDIINVLNRDLTAMDIKLIMNTRINDIQRSEQGVRAVTDKGDTLEADALLYALGREPNYSGLKLSNAGLVADDNGWVRITQQHQTSVPHIYIIGDLAGRPSLASTAMEQGRIAVQHAFNNDILLNTGLLPMAIYTIPEISYIGATEAELKASDINYVVGKAQYASTARGQIIGDERGLLKLLVDRTSREILGIHIIGESASELIHVGQMAMTCKATLDVLANTVYNYPTLAQCYKTAALDCINQLNN